jgi:hypothetical protein
LVDNAFFEEVMGGMVQNCRVERHQLPATRDHMLIRSGGRGCLPLTQKNRKTDCELFYSCIREQITAVLHFLMESPTKCHSLSATMESLYPIRASNYSTPSVPKYSPRRLQLHNFIRPSQGFLSRLNSCLMITVCAALV